MSDRTFYTLAVALLLVGQVLLYGMTEPGDRFMFVAIIVLADIVAASVMVDHARHGRRQ